MTTVILVGFIAALSIGRAAEAQVICEPYAGGCTPVITPDHPGGGGGLIDPTGGGGGGDRTGGDSTGGGGTGSGATGGSGSGGSARPQIEVLPASGVRPGSAGSANDPASGGGVDSTLPGGGGAGAGSSGGGNGSGSGGNGSSASGTGSAGDLGQNDTGLVSDAFNWLWLLLVLGTVVGLRQFRQARKSRADGVSDSRDDDHDDDDDEPDVYVDVVDGTTISVICRDPRTVRHLMRIGATRTKDGYELEAGSRGELPELFERLRAIGFRFRGGGWRSPSSTFRRMRAFGKLNGEYPELHQAQSKWVQRDR